MYVDVSMMSSEHTDEMVVEDKISDEPEVAMETGKEEEELEMTEEELSSSYCTETISWLRDKRGRSTVQEFPKTNRSTSRSFQPVHDKT